MDHQKQIRAFTDDLWNLIDRYIKEFDLPTASFVGVLFIAAERLSAHCPNKEEKKNDEND